MTAIILPPLPCRFKVSKYYSKLMWECHCTKLCTSCLGNLRRHNGVLIREIWTYFDFKHLTKYVGPHAQRTGGIRNAYKSQVLLARLETDMIHWGIKNSDFYCTSSKNKTSVDYIRHLRKLLIHSISFTVFLNIWRLKQLCKLKEYG